MVNTTENDSLETLMKKNGEKPVLCMRRDEGEAVFRYLVAMKSASPISYSVYAEYTDATHHTVGAIPSFSYDIDTAESFCGMLERFGITPLSLEAIYEDMHTP